MRRVVAGATIAATLYLLLFAATTTLAATLGGSADCSLEATSLAADGTTVLDQGVLQGESTEGSQADPFDVDWDGRVDFRFQTGDTVFVNNHWEIYAMGLPVPILQGSDDNPIDLDEIGFVEVGDMVPAGVPKFVGAVYISGWLEGNEGNSRCEGGGWINVVGDPTGTVGWLVMAGLILAGVLFLISTPYTLDWEEGELTPWKGNVPSPEPEPEN